MCYSAASQVIDQLRVATLRGDIHEIEELQRKLARLEISRQPLYFVNAFSHPKLLVFTNQQPKEPQAFVWGLIPSWTKSWEDAKRSWNSTINARGETIFEKASFRDSARNKRCLIYVDAFFEHHHHKGKTYPFRISRRDGNPFILAGLWAEWADRETGEIISTCTIVTTEGNPLMRKIHNNPKAEGPRMPVIFDKHNQEEWLKEIKTEQDKSDLKALIKPYDQDQLKAYPVGKLLGKEALGNVPQVEEEVSYPEIAGLLAQD